MGQLKTSISNLNKDSRIALDLSAVKIADNVPLSNLTQTLMELRSFVFLENNTNILNISYAFASCSNLVSVSAIPSSVTNMGLTFNNCPALSSVTINIAEGKTISADGTVNDDNDVDIYQMFGGTTATGNIALIVTTGFIGDKYDENKWYSNEGTELSNGCWTFRSVRGTIID